MGRMQGLEDYIAKNGLHFTVKLAEKASSSLTGVKGRRKVLKAEKVEELLKKKVWYNTTNSTMGDIVYMVNIAYMGYFPVMLNSRSKCIDHVLSEVGNFDRYEGMAFSSWIAGMDFKDEDFDFSEYIKE